MEAQADLSEPPVPAKVRRSWLQHLGRHQLVSAITTVVDYAVMIVAVSAVGLGPVTGTVLGAGVGAASNFLFGRYFTYQAKERAMHHQAIRYLLVALSSLGLNALGEHLLAIELGMQYILARLIVGTIVSLGWNFPMQRYIVFRT